MVSRIHQRLILGQTPHSCAFHSPSAQSLLWKLLFLWVRGIGQLSGVRPVDKFDINWFNFEFDGCIDYPKPFEWWWKRPCFGREIEKRYFLGGRKCGFWLFDLNRMKLTSSQLKPLRALKPSFSFPISLYKAQRSNLEEDKKAPAAPRSFVIFVTPGKGFRPWGVKAQGADTALLMEHTHTHSSGRCEFLTNAYCYAKTPRRPTSITYLFTSLPC